MLISPTINNVHGRLVSITGTDPAANVEIIETAPDRRRWLIHNLTFTLITDGNPANRSVRITVDDGTNDLFSFAVDKIQSASKSYVYCFANIYVSETFINFTLFHPFPVLSLFPGCRIRTTTTNRQVGDDYSAPQALIEEWIDP